jgi:diguanylate cyclase (GGDEF)-like protein
MLGNHRRGSSTRWRSFGVLACAALFSTLTVAAPADREQGLPIISTFLPSQFNTPASPVGPQAFALSALPDGAIIVAHSRGLLRLGGTSASARDPTHATVLSLASGADGTIYFGGVGEIGYFREFSGEFTLLSSWASRLGVVFSDFWISIAARDGSAYFADSTHVFHWDGRMLTVVYATQPELLAGIAFGDGAMVYDSHAGLVAVDARGAHVVPGSEKLKQVAPCALANAGDAAISVCADGNVTRWHADGANEALPLAPELRARLQAAAATTVGVREDGGLLIGTRRAGFFWLDAQGVLSGHLSGIPEWGESRVFSQLSRHDDGFWAGFDYGVAHVEWPGQVTRFDGLVGLPRAVTATVRIQGELLAVTSRGLYRLLPATADQPFARFETYQPTSLTLFSVAQSDGTLYLASGEGVSMLRDGAVEKIDAQLAYAVLPLAPDGSSLLAGGLSGARWLRRVNGVWSARDLPGIDSEIRYIKPDGDGTLWLSGNYTGVFRLRLPTTSGGDPQIERYGTAEGLPHGRVTPLRLPDGLAFAGADGLLRFDAMAKRFVPDVALRTLLPLAQGELSAATVLDEHRALVVQHDRVRLIERAGDNTWRERPTPLARLPRGLVYRDVRLDTDGSIWIAGNEALFRHRPDLQSTLPSLPRPRIAIEETVASTTRDAKGALQLGVAPATVHARFEEAFFVGVEQLTFRTRLEPLETAWSDWQSAPAREMTQLPGGRYRLALQARDIFGRTSETTQIDFVLAPPWYLRWWAFALYAFALIVLLVLLVRRRERQLRQRADELGTLVRARTQELEQASVTDALTGLRNRHYIEIAGTPWQEKNRGCWLIALVDIDHFKRINDERGHAAGDTVLRSVARQLVGSLPDQAVAVRWGGEEFLVIVALEDASNAPRVVRSLLHAIGDAVVAMTPPPPLAVTCSIGWDVVAAGARDTLDAVLGNADRKLYEAKRAGRDRAYGPGEEDVIRR